METAKKKASEYYQATMLWIEDTYLHYFGENRTSYGVKESLKKTEVTGNKDVDDIQRNVGETIGNTFGAGQPGEAVGTGIDRGVLRGNV